MSRVLVVAVLALVLYALMQVPVTLPALSVVGLVAWAVFSSALAYAYSRRNRKDS